MWERAYEKERDILMHMGCLKGGYTLADLRRLGYKQKPRQQEIMYEAKYDPTGTFMEARCRIYVQGYQYQCRPDPEFPQSVTLGPTNLSDRHIQSCGNEVVYRNGFNIRKTDSQIISHGTADPSNSWPVILKPEETIIVKYPRGLAVTSKGKERKYMLCPTNTYGHAGANKAFRRDVSKWMMGHFNSDLMPEWKVQQMAHDECLYRFDGPLTDKRRSVTFVYMNVDDIESVSTDLDDGLEIMRQFNLKYLVQMCSPQLLQRRLQSRRHSPSPDRSQGPWSLEGFSTPPLQEIPPVSYTHLTLPTIYSV